MGNFLSSAPPVGSNSKSFGNIIDYIATHYILTADFKSLEQLYDENYCNNLVVLTADIIEKNFNDLEITHLAQRVKNKEIVNVETTQKVIFFAKSDLDKLDVNTKLKKKRICEGIAKFYVKIAHLFAAIVMTINPVYTYKDDAGSIVQRKLSEKDQIPLRAKDRKLLKLGLCNNRINSLKRGQDYENIPSSGIINVHPNICTMNAENASLQDEPGIPELYPLYLDKYDYKTGQFTDMTDTTRREYENDLRKFYSVFTGKDPSTMDAKAIRRFNDIKLTDYRKKEGCINSDLTKGVSGSLKDDLFQKYARNLQKMVKTSNEIQSGLLDTINELFIYDLDPKTAKKLIRVKPTLTEETLQKLVERTRKLIIGYYLSCEADFTTGVKLYEAIVENQIRLTTETQLKSLDTVAREVAYMPTTSAEEIIEER